MNEELGGKKSQKEPIQSISRIRELSLSHTWRGEERTKGKNQGIKLPHLRRRLKGISADQKEPEE